MNESLSESAFQSSPEIDRLFVQKIVNRKIPSNTFTVPTVRKKSRINLQDLYKQEVRTIRVNNNKNDHVFKTKQKLIESVLELSHNSETLHQVTK